MSFLRLRNALMARYGWDRRIATLAARYYLGVDTPEDWHSATQGDYGRSLLTQGELHRLLAACHGGCWGAMRI